MHEAIDFKFNEWAEGMDNNEANYDDTPFDSGLGVNSLMQNVITPAMHARIHDLSTRKMHLIRGNRRTAVLTNRTICSIRESLLRPVSIRVLRVIVAVCRLILSTRKMHLIK